MKCHLCKKYASTTDIQIIRGMMRMVPLCYRCLSWLGEVSPPARSKTPGKDKPFPVTQAAEHE